MKKDGIIFDLGGVLEKIDPSRVIESFKKIGMLHSEDFFSLYRQSNICSQFETGQIFSKDFISHIGSLCIKKVSDKAIIDAWCSNQLGIEKSTLFTLKELKYRKYKLYILSNTNPVHYERILYNFKKCYHEEFEKLFDKIFLSYNIKERKPNIAAYQHLIDWGISPSKSVYIDDLEENLHAPKELKLSTLHHRTNGNIEYLLNLFS